MLEKIDFKAKKMTKEEYKPVHDELVGKLVLLQQQARSKGVGLVVLVEGWSGAGKGSRISEIIYELDARATRVHVTEDIDPKAAKKFAGSEWGVTGNDPIMKQFWESLGERSEITFYDRGWYTAVAEQALFGLTGARAKALKKLAKKAKALPASEEAASGARLNLHSDIVASYQQMSSNFEQMLVNDGYAVVKLFVHVSKKEQKKRLEALRNNPDTAWRVSDKKLAMTEYYDQAYELFDKFLESTNYAQAPWTIVNGEDRRAAGIQIARALVEALEASLSADIDEGAEEARKKASENSEAQADGAEGDAKEDQSQEDLVKAYEEQAAAQSASSPRDSKFPIVADYPQIDHSIEKPRIEDAQEYRTQLKAEQARFRKLQEESFRKRVPLMIMYEGWDAAGKGGNIKRIAQAIDARAYRIIPSPAPTMTDLAHPHLWRYWTRMPSAGYVGIYDRSWYGRVLVERVEGFASTDEWARAYDEINAFEQELVQWGAVLLKF